MGCLKTNMHLTVVLSSLWAMAKFIVDVVTSAP